MPSVSPAATGLTQGDYTWDRNSGTFSKSGYTVSGAVKDSRGNGISGAAVTLECSSFGTAYVAGTTTAGADGSYTFSHISASFYTTGSDGKIYAKEYRIKASKDGYAETIGEDFSVPGKDITLTAVTVTTAEAQKTELEKTTVQTINVTGDITGLGDTIVVGKNHTLHIVEGITVTTSGQYDYQLQIPDGKTLTLAGTGTLKANNWKAPSSSPPEASWWRLTAGIIPPASALVWPARPATRPARW